MPGEKTYPEERLIKITEQVNKNLTVDVESLSVMFGVTGATIRADLRSLETKGVVSRTHGGAILRGLVDGHLRMNRDPDYQNRLKKMEAEKNAIGVVCASLLRGEDCLMMDDGTTTLCVARNLPRAQPMTVITNGLSACGELMGFREISVICTGGALLRDDLAFNGKTAEDTVGKFNASCAVLGASGLTIAAGLTAPDEQRAELKKRMIASAIKTFIVADHTKLTRVSLVPVCHLDEIDVLVTDWGANEDLLNHFRQNGIDVVVAGKGGQADGTK